MKIVVPAWWCEPCQAWWPGGWQIDGDPVPAYNDRTCPECGGALVPRGRPVGEWPRPEGAT